MRGVSQFSVTTAFVAAIQLLLLPGAIAFGAESIVTNGDFQKWTDGLPDGWEVEIGAMNGGEEPKSEVKGIKGPALMLRGDTSTMAWHAVSQEIPATPGGRYSLQFESRTKDIQREGRQHNNCYVGVMCFDGAGNPVDAKINDVAADTADWTKHQVAFTVPQGAESTKVMIFLSKSGILGVKNVAVTTVGGTAPSTVRPTTKAPAGTTGLLANGDFSAWTDGQPDGWKVEFGAGQEGREPKSEIAHLGDPGLALRGNAGTRAWYSVSQEVSVSKGGTYTLEFQALSEGIQRQGSQYNNCYAGFMSFDAGGKVAETAIEDLSRVPRWRKFRIDFRVPHNAEKTEVLIFLSKTGTLSVKNFSLKEATRGGSFRSSP